jgi:hypothetical protein
MRLTLKIPESPIERQAFRSRSFRRIIFIACALSLFLATIHSINAKNEVHRDRALLDYLKFRRTSNSFGWLPHSQPVDKAQVSFDLPAEKTDDKSNTIDGLMKQLPEVIRIPFEEAVGDIELEGWEDDWFSSATYNFERKFVEPKLDFVYNCECTAEDQRIASNDNRGQRLGRRIQEHQA